VVYFCYPYTARIWGSHVRLEAVRFANDQLVVASRDFLLAVQVDILSLALSGIGKMLMMSARLEPGA